MWWSRTAVAFALSVLANVNPALGQAVCEKPVIGDKSDHYDILAYKGFSCNPPNEPNCGVTTKDLKRSKPIEMSFGPLIGFPACPNDDLGSLRICPDVPKGTRIYVYDSPNAELTKDYSVILIQEDLKNAVCIRSFDESTKKGGPVRQVFRKGKDDDGHLVGKVSRITIHKE